MPNSPSGMYEIALQKDNTNKTQYVYCYMEELCGSDEGWTRLAHLDMTDPLENCPSGFRLYESGGVRACGRPVSSGGSCASVKYLSNGITYSEVCGRVVGYQYRAPDAIDIGLHFRTAQQRNSIDSFYCDGISLTYGDPRKHIWTLVAGYSEYSNNPRDSCPCDLKNNNAYNVQSFIGSDYSCESGNKKSSSQSKLYTSDALWDGQSCDSYDSGCFTFPGLPWFHKVLGSTSDSYIELRICCDQDTTDEDVTFSYYDIYAKE